MANYKVTLNEIYPKIEKEINENINEKRVNGVTNKFSQTKHDTCWKESQNNYNHHCSPSEFPLLEVSPNLLQSNPDLSCGFYGTLRAPTCFQKLATKRIFLFIFCLASILQGMYYTYFVSVLTTIEKLFQIKSKTTGLIMSTTEIGQIGGGLFLSYYGGRGHRPRWIACSMLLFAASSFLCALPHFLFGKELLREYLTNTPNRESPVISANLCLESTLANNDSSQIAVGECSSLSSTSNIVLGIFFIALLGVGVGQTAVYNLGIPYIDDNVEAKESPSYFGTTIGVRIFGPTLGFILGALCTSKYIDPLSDPGFQPDDPRWVGAWWLGLVIISGCLTITSIFMMMFPKKLPAKLSKTPPNKEVSSNKLSLDTEDKNFSNYSDSSQILTNLEMVSGEINPLLPSYSKKISPEITCQSNGVNHHSTPDVIIPAKTVSRNYIGNSLQDPNKVCHLSDEVSSVFSPCKSGKCGAKEEFQCLSSSSSKGHSDPGNRNLRDFFRVVGGLFRNKILLLRTASSVLHLLPIAGLYTFLPKYLETQFNLTVHTAAIISGTGGILVMGIGIFFSSFIIRRLSPSPRTVSIWIALTTLLYSLGMVILMFIGCSNIPIEEFNYSDNKPLCDLSCGKCDTALFAPICSSDGKTYFSACHAGCSKMDFFNNTDEPVYSDCECLHEGVTASLRMCESSCGNLPWYIALFCLFVIIHSTSEVGGMLITLRCVKPQDKAMALGLISVAVGLFGNVPCPIIYGSVVDSTCIHWRKTCDEQGACQLYDSDSFRYFFHGTTAAVMFAAFLVDILVCHHAKYISFEDEAGTTSDESSEAKLTSFPVQTTHQSPVKNLA